MSTVAKAFVAAILAASAWTDAPVADAQKLIRIGASLSQTGAYAALGQNQLRGYQLCVKHTNEKGGVLGRKLTLVVYDDHWSPRPRSASIRSSSPRTRWTSSSVPTGRPSPRRSPT